MDYAEDIAGLDAIGADDLVLSALRRTVYSQGACSGLGKEFGGTARSIIRDALTLFLKSLSQGCRRMLTVSYPGCADITADERQMIAILAAMQAEDDALLRSHLSWLVKKDYRSCVLDAAQILAELLKQQGLYLALPERQGYPAYRTLSIVREASHVA